MKVVKYIIQRTLIKTSEVSEAASWFTLGAAKQDLKDYQAANIPVRFAYKIVMGLCEDTRTLSKTFL